jgi:hypothetical protein
MPREGKGSIMNVKPISICLASLALFACGEKPSEQAAPPAEPATAAPPAAPAAAPTPPPSTELPPIPDGAKVSFTEPVNGAKIQGPLEDGKVAVAVKMNAEGITVKPAGQLEAGSGHHHIEIDVEPEPAGTVVPKDATHLHFGLGQTEAKLMLTPGEHTLHLQFADGIHRSYGPKLADTIKITVAEGKSEPALAAKADKSTTEPEAHDKPSKHKH